MKPPARSPAPPRSVFTASLTAFLGLSAVAGALLAIGSCSPIMVEEESPTDRRVYVNDDAKNDSLNLEVARDGVKFVLQPGKPYLFSVTTERTTDVLDVKVLQAGGQQSFGKITALHDGTREVFALTSTLSTAGFFTARLLAGAQAITAGEVRHVALESRADSKTDTLRLKLIFIQSLANLPTDASKTAFASAFFAQMNRIFNEHSIVVKGIMEIVDPDLGPLNFPFTDNYVGLRGAREPNYAHLYLVDSISVGDAATGPVGTVLGFSAREVVDISQHRESRVIMANRATVGRLAITAAHELGHFFGMRHTVSTNHDMRQDDDYSNVEDGFGDTRMCTLILGKKAAGAYPSPAPEEVAGKDGVRKVGPYCLRIASNACTEPACDLRNLMHPVECEDLNQTQLSVEQVDFLKRNMALYHQ